MGAHGSEPPVFSLDVLDGDDGRMTVAVAGELDLATAAEFEAAVRHALEAGPVLVDLGAVVFMDSAGVRTLNALVRDGGDGLRMAHAMQPAVVQVLEMTGMMGVLPMEERR